MSSKVGAARVILLTARHRVPIRLRDKKERKKMFCVNNHKQLMNNHNCISVSSVTCPNPEPGFQPSAGACVAQASRSISLDSLYCKGGSQQQQLRFSLAISSQLHSHESALPPQGIRDMCQSCQHRITALCSCPLPCHHRVDSHLSSSFSFLASPLGSS